VEVWAVGLSYTLRYGLTYEDWAGEKARRILECLRIFYEGDAPLDLQILAERVYRERLRHASKEAWMPVGGRLTDHRPSAFIKGFLSHLIERLYGDGYIAFKWIIELHDVVGAADGAAEAGQAGAKPPKAGYMIRILKLPSLEYLRDLCIWRPDPA
jgi:hypothetical protein